MGRNGTKFYRKIPEVDAMGRLLSIFRGGNGTEKALMGWNRMEAQILSHTDLYPQTISLDPGLSALLTLGSL